MGKWVKWRGQTVPRTLMEPEVNPPASACRHCGGAGEVPETIDDEKYDVMVPCHMCRTYCKACAKWVKKSGHDCQPTIITREDGRRL